MPVDYGKMVSALKGNLWVLGMHVAHHLNSTVRPFQQTVAYLLLTVAYAVASSLVFHSYLDDSIIPSLPHWTKTHTLIVAVRFLF